MQTMYESITLNGDVNSTQCYHVDFDTSNKSAIQTIYTYGSDPDSVYDDTYFPSADGIAKFDRLGDSATPLEIIDTSSIEPWKSNKHFPILIIAIKLTESQSTPPIDAFISVYAVSREKHVFLSPAVFKNVLRGLNVDSNYFTSDYIATVENTLC